MVELRTKWDVVVVEESDDDFPKEFVGTGTLVLRDEETKLVSIA